MLVWIPFTNKNGTEIKQTFRDNLQNRIVESHSRVVQFVRELRRWEDPTRTGISRAISRLLFVTSLVMGLFGLFELIVSISHESSSTLNKTGIILQAIATLSVVPEILREQNSRNLQDLIRNASRQLNGRIKFRKIYNDEVFLLLEQNGAFGFINLVGQIWFARTFLLYMGPATLTNSHTGPVLFLLTLLYYIITFLWVYYSLLYWVAKYYNLTLPAWVAGANYFLNLFLIPGPILTFSIVALILWLIVKLLNWVSQFEIKKVFIIITIPFLLTGMLFQFLAA